MAPGLLWLAAFFVLPNIQMVLMSLSTGTIGSGFEFSWAFGNYVEAITRFPDNVANSLVFGGLATLLCFLIGYPLAYGIAFRGGRYKTLLLFPPAGVVAKQHSQPTFSEADESAINELFADLTGV